MLFYHIFVFLYCLQYVLRITTAMIVTPHVVSVQEMMSVTIPLVTVLINVNHIGTEPGVTVSIQKIIITYDLILILTFFSFFLFTNNFFKLTFLSKTFIEFLKVCRSPNINMLINTFKKYVTDLLNLKHSPNNECQNTTALVQSGERLSRLSKVWIRSPAATYLIKP